MSPSLNRTRLPRFAVLAAVFVVAAGLASVSAAPAQAATSAASAPAAATPAATATTPAASIATATAVSADTTSASCGLATTTTGSAAEQLCWLDLSGYSQAEATSSGGQKFSVAVDGGYRLSFTLSLAGGAVHSTALGAWTNAYLGTRGVLTGVAGEPALSQLGMKTTTTVELSGIRLVDAAGVAVSGFSLVGADAESTDAGESLSWRSNVDLTSTTYAPLGDACQGSLTGFGSHTVTCDGAGSIAQHRDGTVTVAAVTPSTFGQTLIGGGEQGVAYALALPSITRATTAAAAAGATSSGPGSAAGSTSLSTLGGPSGWGTTSLITAALLLAGGAVVFFVRRRHAGHQRHALR